jgi:antitoxin YefM
VERTLGIEEARGRLGEIAEEVAASGDSVILARRGRARAILVDREEYARFKEHSSRAARAELQRLLPRVQAQVEEAGLDPRLIGRALDASRRLD